MEGRFERGDGELTLAKPRPIEQQQGRNSEQATMDDFYHGYNEKKKRNMMECQQKIFIIDLLPGRSWQMKK